MGLQIQLLVSKLTYSQIFELKFQSKIKEQILRLKKTSIKLKSSELRKGHNVDN
jgi:hypothetical protein